MIRAIARQAEAERERRAKVIHAEGELQASHKLMQAAQTLSRQSGAMQLRYLQTLTSIASDKSNTIIFPVSMDLMSTLTNVLKTPNRRGLDEAGSADEPGGPDATDEAALGSNRMEETATDQANNSA